MLYVLFALLAVAAAAILAVPMLLRRGAAAGSAGTQPK